MGLDVTGIGAIGDAVSSIVNLVSRFVPDKTAQIELQKQTQEAASILAQKAADAASSEAQGEIDLLKQQIAVNAVEAASPSLFKSGWRPALGWACSGAFVLIPLWTLAARTFHVNFDFPPELYYSLTSMLCALVGVRSFERYHGVSDDTKVPRATLVK
jgi:hypothetical protein